MIRGIQNWEDGSNYHSGFGSKGTNTNRHKQSSIHPGVSERSTTASPMRGHRMKSSSPVHHRILKIHSRTNTVKVNEWWMQLPGWLFQAHAESSMLVCSLSKLQLLTLLPQNRHFQFALKYHFSLNILEMVFFFLGAHNVSPIYPNNHFSCLEAICYVPTWVVYSSTCHHWRRWISLWKSTKKC